LTASLMEQGRLDLDDLARRLIDWRQFGRYAVDARVFDVGIQTEQALDLLATGESPETSGPSAEGDNGNGSLMRVLPLALWHQGTDDELFALAMRQSLPTHG